VCWLTVHSQTTILQTYLTGNLVATVWRCPGSPANQTAILGPTWSAGGG